MTDAEERWNALVKGADNLKDLIAREPNGSHTISGLFIADADQKTLHDINYLLPLLKEMYPDFTFWKSETLFDNKGLTINWRHTPGMSEIEAVNSIRSQKFKESLEIEHEQELKELEEDGQSGDSGRPEIEN